MAADSSPGSVTPAEPVDPPRAIPKRTLIIVGVVAVAVALISGSLLTSRGVEPGRTKPAAAAVSETKPGEANTVATPGSELKLVTAPPARTHVMISLPAGTPESSVSVTFRPYGLGPNGRLVVRIDQATAVGDSEDASMLAKRLTGANLLVRSGDGVSASALRGGEYSGTIKTLAEKDAYAFVLINAEPRP